MENTFLQKENNIQPGEYNLQLSCNLANSFIATVEDKFEIISNESIKDTFFEGLLNTNLDNKLDLEAYLAYKLLTITTDEYQLLIDKYLLDSKKVQYNLTKNAYLENGGLDITEDLIRNSIKYKDIELQTRLLFDCFDYGKFTNIFIKNIDNVILDYKIKDPCFGTDTLLHSACRGNYTFFIKYITDNNSELINIKNNDNETPLHIFSNIIKVDYKEDDKNFVEIKENIEKDIIIVLEKSKNIIDINLQNNKFETILHLCCKNELYKCVNHIIDNFNIDFNLKNDQGKTPFQILCEKPTYKFDILKKIINNPKCDINCKNSEGTPALFFVKKEKTLLHLIENKKIDFNIQDNKGNTILHHCYYKSFNICLNRLIYISNNNDKINLNLKNNKGNTILHLICLGFNEEYFEKIFFQIIQTNKCDINIRNNNGNTCLELIKDYNQRFNQGDEFYDEYCKLSDEDS